MKSKAVIDLAYGDSGKGILVARICNTRKVDAVVRFSGGCQAAHNVIGNDGRHHTFAQFGSGTFSGVRTYLSRYMLFEPFSLVNEADGLKTLGFKNPLRDLMSVAWDAYMTTPYHQILNQWQEDNRGDGRHGSTGRGIGTTAWYASEFPEVAPQAHDLLFTTRLRSRLVLLRNWVTDHGVPDDQLPTVDDLMEAYAPLAQHINIVGPEAAARLLTEKNVVFEGSQGVLLDEHIGFFPHVTRSSTTDENIHKMYNSLGYDAADYVDNIGVVRTYTTRHGHGPFVAEDPDLTLPEAHNAEGHWMGDWRVGHFDLPAINYAVDAMSLKGLYVTHNHVNVHTSGVQIVDHYNHPQDGEWTPRLYDRFDFAGREKQTQRLNESRPIMSPFLSENPAEEISALLWVPLIGSGWGPKIEQGEFYGNLG